MRSERQKVDQANSSLLEYIQWKKLRNCDVIEDKK